jgi:hypothetical protein
MTYTSAAQGRSGGRHAVDIKAKRTERNFRTMSGDLAGRSVPRSSGGTISLTNFRDESVKLEVTRDLLGTAEKADHGGRIEMLSIQDQDRFQEPYWWRWYSWPAWWYHWNGMGRITWDITLESGKSVDLNYTWNYYWR